MKVFLRKMKINKVLFFAMICILLFAGCGKKEAPHKELNLEFYYVADYWDSYDLSKSAFPSREAFESAATQYMKEIEELLGIYNWWEKSGVQADTLEFSVEMGRIGHSGTNYLGKTSDKRLNSNLVLSLKALEAGHGADALLAHELTHIMCGPSFSQSLEEGLCDYVNYRVGMVSYIWDERPDWTRVETFKLLFPRYLKAFSQDEQDKILEKVGQEGGYSYGFETAYSRLWYFYSELFVEYLVEKYGMETTLNLIRNGETQDDYVKYLGQTLEQVKADWNVWIDEIEPSMSLEELNELERENMKKFDVAK